jgi:hypothetical protein
MSTQIRGKGLGGSIQVISTDDAVVAFLKEIEGDPLRDGVAQQGQSNSYWCSGRVVAAVEEMLT